MLTTSARRSHDLQQLADPDLVTTRRELARLGIGAHGIRAQVAAGRWQVWGKAVVLHNTAPTVEQRRHAALINCGPRAVLTSFTAAEAWGLKGWARDEVHVLAPAGTRRPHFPGLVLHRTGRWDPADLVPVGRRHRLAAALIVAASDFDSPRPGCGLLAASVQQRLARPDELRRALMAAPRARHRNALLTAVADISQGAEALSEIDFGRLCPRITGYPTPRGRRFESTPADGADTSTPNGGCSTAGRLPSKSTARCISRRSGGTTTNCARTRSFCEERFCSAFRASSSGTSPNSSRHSCAKHFARSTFPRRS